MNRYWKLLFRTARYHYIIVGKLQASIELPGINDMWSLRTSDTDNFDKYLVQSFTGETKILAISNEEMNEVPCIYYSCPHS
jgi:tmRNA-binding protein